MTVQFATRFRKGPKRFLYEDAVVCNELAGLFGVGDGTGAKQAGNLIAPIILRRVEQGADAPASAERLAALITSASQYYNALAQGEITLEQATCSCALLWLGGDAVFVAHVGDCRVWRVREGRAERLTDDHTLGDWMESQGVTPPDEDALDPRRNVLTRSLGLEDVEPEVSRHDLRPGDCFVLSTNGLVDAVDEAFLSLVVGGEPGVAADAVVARAAEAGCEDDVTVVVVGVGA